MKLLIVLPVKSAKGGAQYPIRWEMCQSTWLRDSPVDFHGFTDDELGLVEIDQHNNAIDPIRTHRTQLMVRWALEKGYDYIFRTDTDTYLWVNRLMACGYEQHDYMGWCVGYPRHLEKDWACNTAHGGVGFFLSRRAMQIVADAPVDKYLDGKYWGDLWAGHHLWKHGIYCHRDTRFLEGSSGDHAQHDGNISADELPLDHPYIALHPVPALNMPAIHEKFKGIGAETTAPELQIWGKHMHYAYGTKRPDICVCRYCHS
jgi:hypothetical protein